MADVITKKCDGPNCDVIKRDSNHWFFLVPYGVSTVIVPFGENVHLYDHDGKEMWVSEDSKGVGVLHFCGLECLWKSLGRRLSEIRR